MSEFPHYFACIMAGGSGERFWPMSRAQLPKHLLKLFSDRTLLEETVRRVEQVVRRENIFVLTNEVQLPATRAALAGLLGPDQIVAEPAKRDTAPAAALATALVRARAGDEAILALLPADAFIHDAATFQRQFSDAFGYAAFKKRFVTFGIIPRHASTAFGYLEMGEGVSSWRSTNFRTVARFVEKPSAAVAEAYFFGKRHLWNGGIFLWKPDVFLAEAERHCPELSRFVLDFPSKEQAAYIASRFPTLPKISIDYAIMEKAAHVDTALAEFDWDDVGLWTALPKHLPSDASGNAVRGAVVNVDSTNNIAFSNGRTIGLVGVKDLVVVETPDAILVCHRDAVQDIKKLTSQLPKELL